MEFSEEGRPKGGTRGDGGFRQGKVASGDSRWKPNAVNINLTDQKE